MTILTAMIISTNSDEDISCDCGGPCKNGKYVGWISLWRKDDYRGPRPLISTEPIYDSKEEAILAMKNIVKEIRENENKLVN